MAFDFNNIEESNSIYDDIDFINSHAESDLKKETNNIITNEYSYNKEPFIRYFDNKIIFNKGFFPMDCPEYFDGTAVMMANLYILAKYATIFLMHDYEIQLYVN